MYYLILFIWNLRKDRTTVTESKSVITWGQRLRERTEHKSSRKTIKIKTGTYRSRLLKQNSTPKRVVNRNAKQTGTTMASISP